MRTRIARTVVAVVAVSLVGAAGYALAARTASSATKRYALRATLNAAHETPAVRGLSGASGTFTATLSMAGKRGTLAWKLTFKGLSGPAIAAHVHVGAAGKSGPVAIPLCITCRSGAHGVYSTTNAKLLAALLHMTAYANVHTKAHPAGEIRGQVTAKPTTAKLPAASDTSTTETTSGGYTNPYGGY